MLERAFMQPLELVGSYMQLQARWVQAAAEAESAEDWGHRLEDDEVLVRIDPRTEPRMFRAAIISRRELESLRSIENVVRDGKVRRISSDRIVFDGSDVPSRGREIYVDCTAAGVRPTIRRPIFEADRLTLQYVTIGIVPWSAASIGVVEALRDDDAEKNRLCPPLIFTGNVSDALGLVQLGMTGMLARSGEPDIGAWNDASRLNPARGVADHLDDPRVPAAFASIRSHVGVALSNLERLVATPTAALA